MPNKYNPFRPDKMAGPGLFSGRWDELHAIDQCLLQTRAGNPQHFLTDGERGLGKSSLFFCAHYVATGHIEIMRSNEKVKFLVLNISLSDQDNYVSIVKKIMTALRAEISKTNALKSIALAAWDFISKFEAAGVRYHAGTDRADESELLSHLQADFVSIISKLDGVADGILLLIDEADKPGAEGNLGVICKLLTEELSRQRCDKLCIGLAGLPNLVEVLRGSHESSPRIFKIMSLKPLEPNEREQVLESGEKEAAEKGGVEVKFTVEAKALISSLSEGYPHFLQEFAYCAWEEDFDGTIDKADVTNSLYRENGAFDQLGKKYFSRFYSAPDSDDYRQVLNVMADHLDNWINRATIIKESQLKDGTVDNALRALKTKNIILQSPLKRGDYRLPTVSFAAWIKAQNTARDVAAQIETQGLFEHKATKSKKSKRKQ